LASCSNLQFRVWGLGFRVRYAQFLIGVVLEPAV
jgi:hypothetical protein